MISPVRLFHPTAANRVALVSVSPAHGQAGQWLVQVALGKKAGKLAAGNVFGPFPEDVLQTRFDEAVAQLVAQGYSASGGQLLVAQLGDSSAQVRARAAQRLGWMRQRSAVDALLAALGSATGDACSILDALGELGDPKAIPALRTWAERKLLSRRRSAAEALRKLGDGPGLADVKKRALERMPDAVRTAVTALPEADAGQSGPLEKVLLALPPKERGPALDAVYELGTPLAVRAARQVLVSQRLGVPHLWRYAKSIFKRALLRYDGVTYGQLAHRIEVESGLNKGTNAKLKSGFDGEEKDTPVFRRRTVHFMQRLAWRWLRRLARWRPERYSAAAAQALAPYAPSDARAVRKGYGAFAHAYVLHKVLRGKSTRYVFNARAMKFKVKGASQVHPPANVREESYPELWDARPEPTLELLANAKLPEVHGFAVALVQRGHGHVVQKATREQLGAMLAAPFEGTVALAVEELSRRFDANSPDFALIDTLLLSPSPVAKELGLRWVKLTAHLWSRDLDRLFAYVRHADGAVRAVAVELAVPALRGGPAELRARAAEQVLAALRAKESAEGEHDRYARLATEALAEELAAKLSLEDVLSLIATGSPATKAIAGALLGRKPDALQTLGLQGLLALAEHEVAAVRGSAVALLGSAKEQLMADVRLLFVLSESSWPEVRAAAIALLREVDLAKLGMDGIVGLCDSNHVDVQDLGKALVLQHLAALDSNELLQRLAQHPHRNVRKFALELVEANLKPGFVALAKLELFFRTALLDVWPDRDLKRRAVRLLADRGRQDERQAEVAAAVLRDVVRTQTKGDFDLVAQALVQLKVTYPALDVGLAFSGGAV